MSWFSNRKLKLIKEYLDSITPVDKSNKERCKYMVHIEGEEL